MDKGYPWEDAFKALRESMEEEIKMLKSVVDDLDSSCPARELRRARLGGLEWAAAVADELERWEW